MNEATDSVGMNKNRWSPWMAAIVPEQQQEEWPVGITRVANEEDDQECRNELKDTNEDAAYDERTTSCRRQLLLRYESWFLLRYENHKELQQE